MVYNLTDVANSTGLMQFTQKTSTELVGGWLGILFLIAIFGILMISFTQKTGSGSKALVAASFICFVMSMFLRAIDLVPDMAWIVFLILSAGSLVLLKSD